MSIQSSTSVTNPGAIANDILDYVWYIRIINGNIGVNAMSGAGIRDSRILTCYHGFMDGFTKIEARRGNGRYHEMKIAYAMPRRDLATLEFKGTAPLFPYLELSDNEILDVGDNILVAGHDEGGPAKETDALIVCSCIHVDPSTFSDDAQFVPNPEEHPGPRPYPIIYNVLNHIRNYVGGLDYHPNLPLILFNDWGPHCSGRSGSPVYRPDHKIVGVFLGGSGFGVWAVHLSAVRDFLERAEEARISGGASSSEKKTE